MAPLVDDKAKERKRNTQQKTRAMNCRDTVMTRIRSVHVLTRRFEAEPDIHSTFLIAASEVKGMWTSFVAEDDNFLDGLIELDAVVEYSTDL